MKAHRTRMAIRARSILFGAILVACSEQPAKEPDGLVTPMDRPSDDSIMPVPPGFHVETAWRDQSELIVHIVAPEGTPFTIGTIAAPPRGTSLHDGEVPHLAPTESDLAQPDGLPTMSAHPPGEGPVDVIVEDAPADTRERWLLLKNLWGIRAVSVTVRFERFGATIDLTIPPALGSYVQTDVRGSY